jgi:hypothetical protein
MIILRIIILQLVRLRVIRFYYHTIFVGIKL